MSSFIADRSKKQVMQISNDAFYYLYYGEEPLDENNIEEAEEVSAIFPNGFEIEDNWKTVEDSDLIEATFIPYIKDSADYDEYYDITNNIQLQIKWLDTDQVKMWWYNSKTGTRELQGTFRVYTNEYGHRCFHTGEDQIKSFVTGKMSLYFLKNFKKRGA